jgi:hypothetical protein
VLFRVGAVEKGGLGGSLPRMQERGTGIGGWQLSLRKVRSKPSHGL